MAHTIEAGRAGRDRTSVSILAGIASEVAPSPLEIQTLQARHIAARFVISDALAKLVAEMVFDKGRLR